MADPKRIPGNPGTVPTGPDPGENEKPPEPTQPQQAQPRSSSPLVREPSPSASQPSVASGVPPELRPAIQAARVHRNALLAKPHVLDVRAGYKFIRGEITDYPAVVVVVDRKVRDLPPQDRIPPVLDGVPSDVAMADPFELVRTFGRAAERATAGTTGPRLLIDELQSGVDGAEEAVPQITYAPPPQGDLSAVTGAMTITCHVSPDAGWRVLRSFLEETERELCLGMYDFTAPHIYRTARALLRDGGVEWRQTLSPNESLPGNEDVDSTKAGDLSEADIVTGLTRVARRRFQHAFAQVGAGRTFASAYHIKVAVRDGRALWLSSGNWQSSNQPNIDFLDAGADRSLLPRYNREWHVTIESPALARRFQVFLEHDLATAQQPQPEAAEAPTARPPELLVPVDEFLVEEAARRDVDVFPPQKFVFTNERPLTVQPILTPDNYVSVVAELLRRRPAERLYFQNQSLNPVQQPTAEFKELMDLLVEYSNDQELDVRMIIRKIGAVRRKLESLKAAGFNMARIRLQGSCHTKGLVIDSRVVLLGSHNFTNQGVQANRDASLLIRDSRVARYYERIFLHDWERLSTTAVREEAVPIPVTEDGTESAAGVDPTHYARMPWSYLEED